jgi:phosphatidylglycerophosphatase A
MRAFIKLLVTGFYTGYIPVVPGTAGSLIGVALYLGVSRLPWYFYLLILIGLFFLGVGASNQATIHFFKERDSRRIVIDEICGLLVTMFLIPLSIKLIIIGFLIFRFVDILKPPPLRRIEELPGGWGIMTDDILAGVYSNLILRAVMVWV